MLLVRSYRTLAPLPVQRANPEPSAVCFCGTVLTVARTGVTSRPGHWGSPDFPQPDPVHRPAGQCSTPIATNLACFQPQTLGRGASLLQRKGRERKEQPSVNRAGQRLERPRLNMTTWGL